MCVRQGVHLSHPLWQNQPSLTRFPRTLLGSRTLLGLPPPLPALTPYHLEDHSSGTQAAHLPPSGATQVSALNCQLVSYLKVAPELFSLKGSLNSEWRNSSIIMVVGLLPMVAEDRDVTWHPRGSSGFDYASQW